MRSIAATVALLLLMGLGVWSACRTTGNEELRPQSSGWGIDAGLSCHVAPNLVPDYLRLLETSNIRWLRERDIGLAGPMEKADTTSREYRLAVWEKLKSAGFRVLAFASTLPEELPVESGDAQLPEDLLKVYHQARHLGRLGVGKVDAWEMLGEPETSYVEDLPDRLAAYEKAVYLGLKSADSTEGGNRGSPPPVVLMGALAFPPGPWLEIAAENGIYDYADAVNFHHYGFARDLAGLIDTQRAFAAKWSGERDLPLWLTEVGLNSAPYQNRNEPAARAEQGAFLVECARQAIQGRLAVFMPFILVHRNDPFAITDSPDVTWPAWQAYRDFTNSHRLLGPRPGVVPPNRPNPVVLQWLPDEGACSPNKISLTYDFDREYDGRWSEIGGKIRVYNLSRTPVRIRLKMDPTKRLSWKWVGSAPTGEFMIGPEACVTWSVEFQSRSNNYVRESIHADAETLDDKGRNVATSVMVFGLQAFAAVDLPHRVEAIKLGSLPQDGHGASKFGYISEAVPEITSKGSQWLGINGVKSIGEERGDFVFDVVDRNVDPLSPPMAIAALPEGLPSANAGFLRLRVLDDSLLPEVVRVDLIDSDGQRFSILENFGRRGDDEQTGTTFLAYADFHRWFFGRCAPGRERLDPARVREIQLRFYGAGSGKRYLVHLDAADFGEEKK